MNAHCELTESPCELMNRYSIAYRIGYDDLLCLWDTMSAQQRSDFEQRMEKACNDYDVTEFDPSI